MTGELNLLKLSIITLMTNQAGGFWKLGQHYPTVGHRVRRLPENPGGSRGARSLHQVKTLAHRDLIRLDI